MSVEEVVVPAPSGPKVYSPQDPASLAAVSIALRDKYIDRDDAIRGLIYGLLTKQHVLLLGPPGTAKSQIVQDFCARIKGANYFQWLMTRYTQPEELFGTVSINDLVDKENPTFKRLTKGKFPESEIAYLDEIFKSGSPIQNTLLTALNERKFHNDGVYDIPLMLCVGASNEMPEDAEASAAFADRFLFRYVLEYVQDHLARKLLTIPVSELERAPLNQVTSFEAITKAQNELVNPDANGHRIEIPDDIINKMISLRSALRGEGIVLSDRRFRWLPQVVKAAAWLDAYEMSIKLDEPQKIVVMEDHLMALTHACWDEPSQLPEVRKILRKWVSPHMQAIHDTLLEAKKVWQDFQKLKAKGRPQDRSNQAIEVQGKLSDSRDKVEGLIKNLKRSTHVEEGKRILQDLRDMVKSAVEVIVPKGQA